MNTDELEEFIVLLKTIISSETNVLLSPIPVLPLIRSVQVVLLYLRDILGLPEELEIVSSVNPEIIFREDIPTEWRNNFMVESKKIRFNKIAFQTMVDPDEVIDNIDEMIEYFSNLILTAKRGISSSIQLTSEFGNETILDERNRLLTEVYNLKRALNKRNRRLMYFRRKIKDISSKATDHDES